VEINFFNKKKHCRFYAAFNAAFFWFDDIFIFVFSINEHAPSSALLEYTNSTLKRTVILTLRRRY
jgi:hypothetical protein